MASEQHLELNDTKLCAMLGWFKIKGSGELGCADSIYVKQSRVFMVERKKPKGTQRDTQAMFQKFMEKNGTDYYLVDDTDHEQIRAIIIEQEEKHFPQGV